MEDSSQATVEDLASAVIERAGHDFTTSGLGFDIELGQSGVYYHVQSGGVETWVTNNASMSNSEFERFVSKGLERGKRLAPDVRVSVGCSNQVVVLSFPTNRALQ